MGRPLRKRTRLLLWGTAFLVPALLLGLLSVKLLMSFADIGGTVRQEYGDYMADLSVHALEEEILDRELVDMIAARFVAPKSAAEVVQFLNRHQRENPLYMLAFFVVPEGLVFYSDLDPERTAAFRPLPGWILARVMDTLQHHGGIPSGLEHLAADDPENPVQVTYFTLEGEDGTVLGAAGFVWDLEQFRTNRAFLERVLIHGLDDRENLFRGAFFESPMAMTLLDQQGRALFATAESGAEGFITQRHLDRVLPFYSVGVQLQDDRFNAWIRSVVSVSAALIAAMFLMIVLALGFSLRFVLHEIELAELKSTLVSNVSHELKTPLALIRLYSETLELGRVESEEKGKEFLRIIGRESQRLTHLINNVLDLSRIEQGRKTYRFQEVDLAARVRETVEAYRFSLAKQGFVVESVIEDIPLLSADGEAMTQALINLMDNAIKYSEKDKRLTVGLRQEAGHAVVSVTDHGLGIAHAEHHRIFDTFYRVERGLVHNIKGSGLGLSLVRHIAEGHGGRVTVDSRPGEGSTFSIHLPLDHRPVGNDAPDSSGGSVP